MSTPPDSRLRAVLHRQAWRIWDGAVVVFEPLSGDTHRIDHPAGSILSLLVDSESSRAAVESAVGPVATTAEIDEALELLQAMELVEPA